MRCRNFHRQLRLGCRVEFGTPHLRLLVRPPIKANANADKAHIPPMLIREESYWDWLGMQVLQRWLRDVKDTIQHAGAPKSTRTRCNARFCNAVARCAAADGAAATARAVPRDVLPTPPLLLVAHVLLHAAPRHRQPVRADGRDLSAVATSRRTTESTRKCLERRRALRPGRAGLHMPTLCTGTDCSAEHAPTAPPKYTLAH